jgi:hypothetical protein
MNLHIPKCILQTPEQVLRRIINMLREGRKWDPIKYSKLEKVVKEQKIKK